MDGQAAVYSGHTRLPRAIVAVPNVRGLARPQLLAALDPVRTSRIGLVIAPAGTGKTTLMAQWAGSLDFPAAWCRLEAAAAVQGRLVEWLWQALSPWLTDHGARPPSTADELALLLERRTEPLLLVVDDLHTVAGTTSETELEQFLVLAPAALRVLIGSRRMPTFNLARSEIEPPVVLTGDDLRFRTWEVERLFRNVHRAPLAPEDVAALTRYTQGWAAALQLFHLSTLGGQAADRRRAVHALAGRSRYAQDYLSAQVLAGLPIEMQDFLRRTCVFDVLTARRCDTLLGTDDSQRTLLELEHRQALTTSEDGGQTFTYHEVLRRHLETALREELGPAPTREWYQRAAQVLEEEDAVVEAVRARCRAEDWGAVQRLLGTHAERVLGAGVGTDDNSWTQMLPTWLTETDPWCCLAEARRLLADGQLSAAEDASRRAEAQFTEPLGRALCQDVRRSVATWRGAPPPPRPRWGDVLRAATRSDPLGAARRARELDDDRAVLAEGIALVLAGDRRGGRRVLRPVAEDVGSPRIALVAQLVLATVSSLGERPPHRTATFDRVQVEAERRGMPWLARLANGLAVSLGGHRARAETAAILADCESRGDRWAAVLIEASATLATLRSGRSATDALESLADRLRELDAGVLEVWIRAIHALEAATLDLPEAAATARAAEAAARTAGVPGASAFAYAALAATRPADRDELLSLARSTAISAGLDCRPWSWLPRVTSPAPGASGPGTGPEGPTADRTASPSRPRSRDGAWGATAVASDPDVGAGAVTGAPERPVGPATPPDAPPGRDRAPAAEVPAAVAAPVELTCFGAFRLVVDGDEIDLGVVRPRARATLKFLSVHAGRPVHREILADALWGDLDPDAAMHNLQVSVSSLRGALEPGVPGRKSRLIVRDGEAYTLALRPGSRCDVATFETALAAAADARRTGGTEAAVTALGTALAAYGGDLFPEEGPADWVVSFRERYRSRAAEAAAALAEIELERGRTVAAVAAAQRSTEIDEYRDDAWRILIEALRRAGEPAGAQRAMRSYARVLSALGVSDAAAVTPARGTPPPPPRPESRASPRTSRGS
ncbi:BTAD domain-containing putative transcriptional regulator [Georgenia wangjunii]|uniref:BTAD domain-containing putative transcriptional regulator n=1 Tax=Georgenia wangjunii TaxID=3117730 RepID=UPI002F26DB67